MNPATVTFGLICLISFFGCVGSIVFSEKPTSPVEEGDLLGMVNPGRSNNPDEKPRPFVAIEHVLEVKEGKALIVTHYLNADGTYFSSDPKWMDINSLRHARKWMGNTK